MLCHGYRSNDAPEQTETEPIMARTKTPKPGAAYYEGGYRFVRDGIPCRMAAWVKDLSPNARNLLLRHSKEPRIDPAMTAMRYPQTTYLPLFDN